MFCGVCNNDVSECICPDIDERLAKLKDSPNIAMKWCRECDKYYARCKCQEPKFFITGITEKKDKLN